jgi:hypothetical protein
MVYFYSLTIKYTSAYNSGLGRVIRKLGARDQNLVWGLLDQEM